MAGSRKAKIRVIAGVAMLPVGGGAFVLALVEAATYADALQISLIVTACMLACVLTFSSLGVRRLASEECEVRPNQACWLGFALSPLLGMLVLLELLRDGRQLPQYLSSLELSPMASTGFVTIGGALTLLGMGLIAYDLGRTAINRVFREIEFPEPEESHGRNRHYWPFNRLAPELDRFRTDEQAEDAQKRASSRVRFVAFFIVTCLLTFPSMSLLSTAGNCAWISIFNLPILFTIAGVYLCLRRETFRRSIREDLRKIGVPICIQCGYDIRGQVEPRCPECGSPFDAGLVDPGVRPDGGS